MAKKKMTANSLENIFENDTAATAEAAPPPATTPPAPAVPMVRKHLQQTWTEPMQAAPPAPPPPAPPPPDGGVVEIEDEEENEYEGEESPLESLMREIGSDSNSYDISVWELPNYAVDRNASTAAVDRRFCGTFTIPPNVGSLEELTRTIQERFATPGQEVYFFKPILRKGRRLFRNLPVMTVRGMPGPKPFDPAAQLPPAPPADPFGEFQKSLDLFERVSKIMRPINAAAPIQSAAPAGELTEESAFLKLIQTDPDKLDAIRRRIFGGEPSGNSGDDDPLSLGGIIKLIAPSLAQAAVTWFSTRQANGAAPGATAPTQTAPPPMPTEPPAAEDIFFANLWNAASQAAPVEPFAVWAYQFEAQAPEVGPYLSAMLDILSPVELARFIRKHTPNIDPRASIEPLMLWFENFINAIRRREEGADQDAERQTTLEALQ